MTSGSKIQPHSSPASKVASSSLIIQLPTTSANEPHLNQQTQSDPANCRGLLGHQTGIFNHRHTNQAGTNLITQEANHLHHLSQHLHTSSQRQNQHERLLHHHHHHNHRYQQNIAQAATNGGDSLRSRAAGVGEQALESGDESSGTPPPNYHEIPGIVPSYHGRTSGPPPAYDDVVNPNAPPPSYQSLFGQVREAHKSSNGLVDLLRQLFLVLIGTLGCTMIIGFLLLIPITMIFIGLYYMNECRAENIPAFLVIGGLVWIMKNILNCYNQFKKDSNTINRPPPPRRNQLATTAITATTAAASSSSPSHDNGQPSGATATTTRAVAAAAAAGNAQAGATQPAANSAISTTPAPSQAGSASSTRSQYQANIRHPPMIGITSYKFESILNYFLIVWFLAGCIVVYRIYEPDYENPLSSNYCNRTVYLYAFWLMTSAFIIMAIILSCLCCLMASSLMSCSQGR